MTYLPIILMSIFLVGILVLMVLAGGRTPAEVSVMLPELFGLEEDIEKRLSKPASLNVAEGKIAKANEINPQELFEEEVNVDDIPF